MRAVGPKYLLASWGLWLRVSLDSWFKLRYRPGNDMCTKIQAATFRDPCDPTCKPGVPVSFQFLVHLILYYWGINPKPSAV